jgi:SAM-dependent methyltransferase/ADP-heptose:LPS heptosyltransferase
MIAVSHPGKIGDALYCLPTIRYLCDKHNTQADFFTSAYCEPLRRFFEYQSCIRKVIVPEDYKIEHGNCGIQPWHMSVPEEEYECVYELGFRRDPDKVLPDFIADTVGAPNGLPIYYEFPPAQTLAEPYIVIAPGRFDYYRRVFSEVARHAAAPVVIIGARGEHIEQGIDKTGLDLLDTLPWLEHAQAFLGVMSSSLVLANAFNIPKISLHDGQSWDLRPVMKSPLNYYPVNPSPLQLLAMLGMAGFSKTLHPKDYGWIGEAQHIHNMISVLQNAAFRFEHQHRHWEYGLVVKALRANQTKTVLDVGGGGSLFAPSAAWVGMEVTQVDPSDCAELARQQSLKIGHPLRYYCQDFLDFSSTDVFDAVCCISVIEHVPKEREFFLKLLQYVKTGGLLALTTDFHPSGTAMVDGHLRTYNQQTLTGLAQLAQEQGFEYFGSKPNYSWYGPQVNSYTFASLIMKKTR